MRLEPYLGPRSFDEAQMSVSTMEPRWNADGVGRLDSATSESLTRPRSGSLEKGVQTPDLSGTQVHSPTSSHAG